MTTLTDNVFSRKWPSDGFDRVPIWAYSDPEVYRREMELIFFGKSWSYVTPNSTPFQPARRPRPARIGRSLQTPCSTIDTAATVV